MTIRAAFGLPEYHLPQPTAPRLAAALGMAAWQLSGQPSHLVGRLGRRDAKRRQRCHHPDGA